MSDWPFEDSPGTAAITLRRIIHDHRPILYVSRATDDGMFQFLDGQPVSPEDGVLVGLDEMLDIDASLRDIADLPLGWTATRPDLLTPWTRAPHP